MGTSKSSTNSRHSPLSPFLHSSFFVRVRRETGKKYADDFVVGFEHEADARRFWDALRARLEEFALSLHPDKTRLIRRRSQKDLSLSSSSHVQDNQPTLCCKVGAVCNNTKPLSCAQTKNATLSRPAQSRYSMPDAPARSRLGARRASRWRRRVRLHRRRRDQECRRDLR